MNVIHDAPWLIANLGAEMRVLSWALNRPGFVTARRIVFREVQNRDLPEDLDPGTWLDAELASANLSDAPSLLTSRAIASYRQATAQAGGAQADCLVTAGLSNAERVGHRRRDIRRFGTINIAVRLSTPLTEAAQIEALTIAAQARTAAVMDAAVTVPGGIATGTGTDCIALAAPPGDTAFAGLHTDVGEALGAAVYRATSDAITDWLRTRPDLAGDTADAPT